MTLQDVGVGYEGALHVEPFNAISPRLSAGSRKIERGASDNAACVPPCTHRTTQSPHGRRNEPMHALGNRRLLCLPQADHTTSATLRSDGEDMQSFLVCLVHATKKHRSHYCRQVICGIACTRVIGDQAMRGHGRGKRARPPATARWPAAMRCRCSNLRQSPLVRAQTRLPFHPCQGPLYPC